MKTNRYIYIGALCALSACADLDLNPLSQGSSESWYSTETEIDMSVNDLYRDVFWPDMSDSWTDDYTNREALTPITNGTINGEWATVNTIWTNNYKTIARCNTILLNLDKVEGKVPQATIDEFRGNALFVRAQKYAELTFLFGDVVYTEDIVSLEEGFTMGQTDKDQIKEFVYRDFDLAAELLPASYSSSENTRGTKGAALAFKARYALEMGDWDVAKIAAKACMDLGQYQLYQDYDELFLTRTRNPKEVVFSIPRSRELNVTWGVRDFLSRNAGGWGGAQAPSWDLFSAFLCSDGLPIDESPLYDPHNPFKNRDPRCVSTIVAFQSNHLNFTYEPHPDTLTVMNFNTGNRQTNNDTRSVAAFASFNGLLLQKGVDEDWLPNFSAENDRNLIRYADVLLMYAEASIELQQIDQSVLDAINMVRARAYKVGYTDAAAYPAVTSSDPAELRKTIRYERRMEFAFEGNRYRDIIRWKIAEKALNQSIYGLLDPAPLREQVVKKGLWFFPMTPDMDDNGIPNLAPMYDAGLAKRLAIRSFDASKQYLWPLPTKEILINDNLVQNPGY